MERSVAQAVQLLIDGENLYMKTVEYLKGRIMLADTVAATEFTLQRLEALVNRIEDHDNLEVEVGRYYLTRVGVDALRSLRVFEGFMEQLKQLGIEIVIVEKRNDKSGNVDPRLICDAYRLLIEKKAPSHLLLVCGDKDYEPMLVDYQKLGRKVAVCFYPIINGGASIDLLCVSGVEFINFASPEQSWTILNLAPRGSS